MIRNKFDLDKNLEKFLKSKSLSFLEVRTSINKIKDLPRPKNLVQVKKDLSYNMEIETNSINDFCNFIDKSNFKKIFVLCGLNSYKKT